MFAGVQRDSLSLKEIKQLHEGGSINKTIPSKLFKSFKNLTVKIKDISLTISANREKVLIGNTYKPVHITLENSYANFASPMIILFKKISYHINKIVKLLS